MSNLLQYCKSYENLISILIDAKIKNENAKKRNLVPNFEKTIPRSSANGHTIFRYA